MSIKSPGTAPLTNVIVFASVYADNVWLPPFAAYSSTYPVMLFADDTTLPAAPVAVRMTFKLKPAPAAATAGKVIVLADEASIKITFPESALVNWVVVPVGDDVSLWFLESTKSWYCLEVLCFKPVVFLIAIVKIIFVC